MRNGAFSNALLPYRGECGPAVANKRRTVNGILWVLRTGAEARPFAFALTGGEAHEVKGYEALTGLCDAQPEKLVAKRATAPMRSAMTSKTAA